MNSFVRAIAVVLAACSVLALATAPALSAESDQVPSVTFPRTPAGAYLARFVETFNTGDEIKWHEFIVSDPKAANSTAVYKRRMGAFKMLYGDLGGMDVWRIIESSDHYVLALMKARQPQGPIEWVNLGITLDPLPPHGLAAVDVRPGDDPTETLPEGPLTEAMIVSFIEDQLNELVAQDLFSGAVLVAKDGRPIFKRAHGLASKRFGVANRIDTKFNLGSMNKMFTGVAVAQLAQQGKLLFDDPIIKHVPDYPNKEIADKVTIHHLLTHTSGMGSYWEELWQTDWMEIRTVEQLIELFADKPLAFEPGERFHYSNSGPTVLGLIVERITGQSYYDYVRQHIYEPAGMTNSDCYEMDHPTPNLAIGYTKQGYSTIPGDGWRNNLFMHTVKGGPAGGGYSTVEDLLRFDQALRNHVLLNEEYTGIVTTGKADDSTYAYLFGDRTIDGHRVVGHNGGAPGISASLMMFWDTGYTVAVMSNYDGAADRLARKIRRLLTK